MDQLMKSGRGKCLVFVIKAGVFMKPHAWPGSQGQGHKMINIAKEYGHVYMCMDMNSNLYRSFSQNYKLLTDIKLTEVSKTPSPLTLGHKNDFSVNIT